MSSGERQGGQREQEPLPYYRAARFAGEKPAGQAYFAAQELIFSDPECDLSVYRLMLNLIYHVAALGEEPSEDLDSKLQNILAAGEPTTLPDEVLKQLQERRAQASKQGPWIERHFR